MKNESPIFIAVEEDYKNLAAQYGIELTGSYDPSKVGDKTKKLFDGLHPNDSCMKKVLF